MIYNVGLIVISYKSVVSREEGFEIEVRVTNIVGHGGWIGGLKI